VLARRLRQLEVFVPPHPRLTAIAWNLRSAGLMLPVCLVGCETLAIAAEPLVIQGSDTFTLR